MMGYGEETVNDAINSNDIASNNNNNTDQSIDLQPSQHSFIITSYSPSSNEPLHKEKGNVEFHPPSSPSSSPPPSPQRRYSCTSDITAPSNSSPSYSSSAFKSSYSRPNTPKTPRRSTLSTTGPAAYFPFSSSCSSFFFFFSPSSSLVIFYCI